MKTFKAIPRLKYLLAAAAAGSAIFMAGCSSYGSSGSAYYTNGEPYYYTSDYYSMGSVYDPYYYYYKSSASEAAMPGEQVLEPLTFHPECNCFVRRATFTGVQGYERDRIDTVTFLDASGVPIPNTVTTVKASKVLQKRHVVSAPGGRDLDVLWDLTVDIATNAGVKTGIWNGKISGTYNGVPIDTGRVESVVRVWNGTAFGYPQSGQITIDHPNLDMVIQFQPDSTANVTITDTRNDRMYFQTVDQDFNETAPVAKP